jgi:alpha-L-rhamnosidase
MQLTDEQINHRTHPLGVALGPDPVFSFTVENQTGDTLTSEGSIAPTGHASWQIRVIISIHPNLTDPLGDSGWQTASDTSSLCLPLSCVLTKTGKMPVLQPRTRYWWRAQARFTHADNTNSASSQWTTITGKTTWFETGKLFENWKGQWITCESGKTERHPIFSRSFHLDQSESAIDHARLYVCGLGLAVSFMDGHRIGRDWLEPGNTSYRDALRYQTLDVTDLLTSTGKSTDTVSTTSRDHRLDILLGNGWYRSRQGWTGVDQPDFSKRPWELIAELHISYQDGSEQVIASNDDWTVSRSPIVSSGIYNGEVRDDTLPTQSPQSPVPATVSTDSHPPLKARISMPITCHEHFPVCRVFRVPDGSLIFDLGQNFAGIFRCRVHLQHGWQVTFHMAEHVQNGDLFTANLRTARQEYVYTSDGREHVLQPELTYYGYRYAKVTVTDEKGQRVDLSAHPVINSADFQGIALYSDIAPLTQVATGDAKVNRLISNASWGMKSNFLGLPTDCPQRDERLGWTGDAQVFAPTASYLRQTGAFYDEFLTDMRCDQIRAGGRVADIVPDIIGTGHASAVWGDAACLIPWTLYRFTGDSSILSHWEPLMHDWVDWIHRTDGDNHGWEKVWHYGDWLALNSTDTGSDRVFGGTDRAYVADVYYLLSTRTLVRTLEILGKQKDADQYHKLEDQIRDYIEHRFFAADGHCLVDTQTGLLLALAHGLVNDRSAATRRLRELFRATGDSLRTGFVGTSILCDTLTDAGLADLATTLLLNEGYPSWLYAVDRGATTIWERWNSEDQFGRVNLHPDKSDPWSDMNSLNHYSYGAVVEWIISRCAGLRQADSSTGFRSLVFDPHPDARLGSASARYHSASGTWAISWRIVGGREVGGQGRTLDTRISDALEPGTSIWPSDHADGELVKLRLSVPPLGHGILHLAKPGESNPSWPIGAAHLQALTGEENNPVFSNWSDGVCHLGPGDYEVLCSLS